MMTKTLCCALALLCIATGTACRQTTATTSNTNARRMQLERSVYRTSHPQNFHNVLKR